jgi:CubicO group peptidase (beta-lactamase class C family)
MIILVCLVWLAHACENDDSKADIFGGINNIPDAVKGEIDEVVGTYGADYKYISLGVILEGDVALTRCYKDDRFGKSDEYASVSKPVTSMITMQFLEKGMINSLDDPIGDYCEKYKDVLPDAYPDVPITFAHLLSHRSGIPHHDRIWKDGKLDLAFAPGESIMYSTRGYGVLGEVLEEIADKSYNKLVKEYIGEPVGANSIESPWPFFEAPGGLVQSTISDMALFAAGVMNGIYVSDSLMYGLAWIPIAIDPTGMMGMGWYIEQSGTEDLTVYHAGSNGKPRAFLMIKPKRKSAVVILARSESSDGPQLLEELARKIMDILDHLISE